MSKYWPVLLIVLLAANCTHQAAKTDVASVENDIRAHLPIGSSRAAVSAYLDQRTIPHAWLQKAESSPDGKTVIPDSHIETGIIRDVRTDGFIFNTFVSIEIHFKFDDADSKLVGYTVREVYKGL